MNVRPLFGSYYHAANLNVDLELVAKCIYDMEKQDAGRVLSNEGGWQSNELSTYQINANMRYLLELIVMGASPIMDYCKFKGKIRLRNAWANINRKNDYNISHIHTHSVISGTFYVKVQKDCGKFVFENPNEALPFYLGPVEQYNEFNSVEWAVEPQPGMVLYFPSYLRHYVLPNKSGEDRISVAFNLDVVS